jgi:hypothetical protein
VALPAARTHLDFTDRVIPNDLLNILDFNYFYNGRGRCERRRVAGSIRVFFGVPNAGPPEKQAVHQ